MTRETIEIQGFAELTLASRDPETVAAFYVDVFAMRRLQDAEDRIWLAVGPGARLGLWLPGVKEFGDQGGAHVHFAFAVDPRALDVIAERARAAGVAVQGPVHHDGGDRSLYVTDPEGNRVEAWDVRATATGLP